MSRLFKAGVMGALTGSLLVSCAPSTPEEQPAAAQATTNTSARTPLAPVFSGYADVNGIKLYHEIYGQANRWSCCTAA